MEEKYKVVEYKGYNINIYTDYNSQSPREWSNLGRMYTMHRRYQPEKSFADNFVWGEVFDEHRDFLPSFEKNYIALKFYLYDHGGQTVSTSPFSCRWDSGLYGIIAVDIESVKREYNWTNITQERREKIEQILRSEVHTYNQFLTDDVYGYNISECDNEGNMLNDSCWGYFGEESIDYMIEDAKSNIDIYLQDPETIKRTKILDEVKQFAKDLFIREGVEAELKLTF